MTYQALARKWRPHNFTETVGQDHVVNALINALQHERLHHAYLFTGTRGVGKTTIARILAKAINCTNLQNFNPCGECEVCRGLDEGRFIDLIEVDAASRTKVEDTRELLENAQYAPNQGRYKVYIIDEVHMLSGHSFNALLKTLEEPPPHVKFLLATTEPQKIPVTVLSRCLQFNLKRLSKTQISQQMAYILGEEKIDSDDDALALIAQAADGSMRDALSLLDQAIVQGNGVVNAESVYSMLGIVAKQPVAEILTALARQDATAVVNSIAELANLTPDFNGVLQQILQVLHKIALVQAVPTAVDDEMVISLAQVLRAEDVQLYYQIALIGQRDINLAPDMRTGFEMIMLRMLAFRPETVQTAATNTGRQEKTHKKAAASIFVQDVPVKEPVIEAKQSPEDMQGATENDEWHTMIDAMQLSGITRQLANNCVLESVNDVNCVLLLDPEHKQLLTERTEENLQAAIKTYYKKPIKVVYQTEKTTEETPANKTNRENKDRQQAAVDAINTDENIQAFKDQFDARVLPGSIEPL